MRNTVTALFVNSGKLGEKVSYFGWGPVIRPLLGVLMLPLVVLYMLAHGVGHMVAFLHDKGVQLKASIGKRLRAASRTAPKVVSPNKLWVSYFQSDGKGFSPFLSFFLRRFLPWLDPTGARLCRENQDDPALENDHLQQVYEEVKKCVAYAVTLIYSVTVGLILWAGMTALLGAETAAGAPGLFTASFGSGMELPAAVTIAAMGGLVNYCLARGELSTLFKEGWKTGELRLQKLKERYGLGAYVAAIAGFALTAVLTVGSACIAGAMYLRAVSHVEVDSAILEAADGLVLGQGMLGAVVPWVAVSMVLVVYSVFFFRGAYNMLKDFVGWLAHRPYQAEFNADNNTVVPKKNGLQLGKIIAVTMKYYTEDDQNIPYELVVENTEGKRFAVANTRDNVTSEKYKEFVAGSKVRDVIPNEIRTGKPLPWHQKVGPHVLGAFFALVSLTGCVFFTLAGMDDLAGLGAKAGLQLFLGITNGVGCAPFFAKGGYALGKYLQGILKRPLGNLWDSFAVEKDEHGNAIYVTDDKEYLRQGDSFVLRASDSVANTALGSPDEPTSKPEPQFAWKEAAPNTILTALYLASITVVVLTVSTSVFGTGAFAAPIIIMLGLAVARWGVKKLFGLGRDVKRCNEQKATDAKGARALALKAEQLAKESEHVVKGEKTGGQDAKVKEAKQLSPATQQMQVYNELKGKLPGPIQRARTCAVSGVGRIGVDDRQLSNVATEQVEEVAAALMAVIVSAQKQQNRARRVADKYAFCEDKNKRYVRLDGVKSVEDPVFILFNAFANGALVGTEPHMAESRGKQAAALGTSAEASAGACAQPNTAPGPAVLLTENEYTFFNKQVAGEEATSTLEPQC